MDYITITILSITYLWLNVDLQNCDKRSDDQDQPIFRYYEKFNNLFVKGQRPTQQHLVEFFKDIQLNLVPK